MVMTVLVVLGAATLGVSLAVAGMVVVVLRRTERPAIAAQRELEHLEEPTTRRRKQPPSYHEIVRVDGNGSVVEWSSAKANAGDEAYKYWAAIDAHPEYFERAYEWRVNGTVRAHSGHGRS